MTREKFQEGILYAFKNYSKPVDNTLISFSSIAIEKAIGFSHNWEKIFFDVFANEKFFPNLAVIIEYAKKQTPALKEQTTKEKAIECVDRYIAYLNGHLKHEEISPYDHSYYKKRFNCDKYAVQSGNVNLNFKRKEWIDICELDFETHKRTGELPFMLEAKESVFPGLQMKTIEGSL